MKEFFKDWRVHLLCGLFTLAAELIGKFTLNLGPVSCTFYPMLYTVVFGVVLGAMKVIPQETMKTSSSYMMTAILLFGARSAATIGPNIGTLFSAGLSLILQNIGHAGTAIFAIPIGVFVFGMGRSVVGAGFSISREGSMLVIGEKYGLASEEGIGVMGGYFTGTLFGAVVAGVMGSMLANLDIFHPYALAMAAGCGSATMMSANIAPLMEAYPSMADELYTLAFSANMVGGMLGLYFNILIALPFANWLYKVCWKLKGKEPPQAKNVNVKI